MFRRFATNKAYNTSIYFTIKRSFATQNQNPKILEAQRLLEKGIEVGFNRDTIILTEMQFWNNDELELAKKSFENSISQLPTSDAFYNLGNVFHSLGNVDSSIANWKKSLEQSERADALVNLANVYALSKVCPFLRVQCWKCSSFSVSDNLPYQDFKSALPYYERALELDQEDGEVHYNYAVVLDNDGQLEKAIEQYQIALSFGIVQAENTLRNARARWVSQLSEKNKD